MAQIKTEEAYKAALKRVEYLEDLVTDDTPVNNQYALELDMLIDLIEEYEDIHYPIGKPSLIDIIKLRMYEMGLSQKAIANMLGISEPRMSEIMHGKTEPSLSLARSISQKLNIDANIVLGV